jgi:hypothetical protein
MQEIFEVSPDVNIDTVVFGVVTLYTLKMKAEFFSVTPVSTSRLHAITKNMI